VVDEGRLPGRLRSEDLHDAPTWQAADAEREVEGERPGRHGARRDLAVVVHPHDRAFAELALDLTEGDVEGLLAIHFSTS
jgi:hypothetical protein